jgi:hypothetical protein
MANDFSGDAGCKALWRFESGALTADSKGTNTLTAYGTPAADTVDFKEGAACVNLVAASLQYFDITDANLDAGFPLKNGDTVKTGAFVFWFKETSVAATRNILYKGTSLRIYSSNGGLNIRWYYSSTLYETFIPPYTFSTGVWYHVTISFDGVNKIIYICIFNTATQILTLISITPVNVLYVTNANFVIGADTTPANYLDGRLDEMVVFNRLLTPQECLRIKDGVYAGALTQQDLSQFLAQAEWQGPTNTFQVSQALVQIEKTTPGTKLYAFQQLAQVEFELATLLEVDINRIGLEITPHFVLAQMITRRKFPLPPEERILQSQVGKRSFPIPQ